MAFVDLDRLGRFIKLPTASRDILEGPEKQIMMSLRLKLSETERITATAYVVYYCTVRGPAKGGIRMMPDVTLEETTHLSELMAWKTALVKIPFGGGKSGIKLDPSPLTRFIKSSFLKEWVHQMRLDLERGVYIPAPDMNTGPADMAVIVGETRIPECVTGKPTGVGGLPGRLEATGWGVAAITRRAAEHLLKTQRTELSVAIQGFGNVGSYAAQFCKDLGFKVVAVSDVNGAIANGDGFDVPRLIRHVNEHRTVAGFPGQKITNDELLSYPCDILIPAASGDVITEKNADAIRAKLIVEAANNPVTRGGDHILVERGIPVVPDILANAGGVVGSYVEWHHSKSGAMSTKEEVFDRIERVLGTAWNRTLAARDEHKCDLRTASLIVAAGELIESMRDRNWI